MKLTSSVAVLAVAAVAAWTVQAHGALSAGAAAAPAAPAAASAPPPRPSGYLGLGIKDDGLVVMPPPPPPGSPLARADEAVFQATRALKDTPRWAMAASDAEARLPDVLHAFDCAVGVQLDPAKAPAVLHVIARATGDDGALIGPAKEHYGRPRPLTGNDEPICVDRASVWGAAYPSGHATVGWTWAMILAELAPDRAGAILARGRAFGDSRVVCGVHWVSDVQAGRIVGSTVMAKLNANAEFESDMKAARAELDALRASGAPPARDCAAEAALVSQPAY
jgi:acid phosphatase (class A)